MLSEKELTELEATLLPALERHHLRLLSHSLRTLQAIADRQDGDLPEQIRIEAWARAQPQLAEDDMFLDRFVQELLRAGDQLAGIAALRGLTGGPLALRLSDLAAWAVEQADLRLAGADLSGNQPTAAPPRD